MSKRHSGGSNSHRPRAKRSRCLSDTEEPNHTPLRFGKLVRITLTNFMCHANLSVEFHPRINFLIGGNGSGKSAIMAALTIGLGAKARATNRSTSIKQLIKNGENIAKIEIVLSNEGSLAFEPDVYGNSITVIRTIHQSGSTTYTLKSSTGAVISKKFDELQRILTYFNIHVDNPVFMLNQDNARDFLKELEPSKNYDLFLKATQIQHLTEKLQNCAEQRELHKLDFDTVKLKCKKLLEELAELENKLDSLQTIEKMKEFLSAATVKYTWKKIVEQEKELDNLVKEIKTVQAEQVILAEKGQSEDKLREKLIEDIKQHEVQLREKEADFHKEHALLSDFQRTYSQKEEETINITTVIKSLKKRLLTKRNQLQELETHIMSSADNSDSRENLRSVNNAKLANLEEKYRNNVQEEATANTKLKALFVEKNEFAEKLSKINSNRDNAREKLGIVTSRIMNLQSSTKNKLAIYGTHHMNLCEEIQKANRKGLFSMEPRGPIGQYIEVPNEKDRDIVESQLKPLMHAFLVNNKKDCAVIQEILKSKFPPSFHPSIIISKFMSKVYDVKSGMVTPTRGTKLLMDIIKCNDPVVMNCIIDRVQVETVLLTDSKSIAEQITSESENVPRNLSRVLVPQLGLEYYPEPHYRMYSFSLQPARYIQVNIEECLKKAKAEKEEIAHELRVIEREVNACQKNYREFCKHHNEQQSLLQRIAANSLKLKEEINALKNFDYPEHNEVDILRKELEDTKNECSKLEDAIRLQEEKFKAAEECQTIIANKVSSQKERMRMVEVATSETKKKLDDIRSHMLSLAASFRMYNNQLQEKNVQLENLMRKQKKLEEALQNSTKEARKCGPRVDAPESVEALKLVIDDLEDKLTKHKPVDENPEQLRELINAKKDCYDKKKRELKQFQSTISALDNSFKMRLLYLKSDQDLKTNQLKRSFDMLLRLRSFDGSITVDHEAKTLEVKVIPRDSHLEEAVCSTKALSGGERSFSTIALLLSLWGCADHPFYFLDEYDVYTDEVNRAFLTELLIREGEQNPHRQYTFLTPLSMELKPRDYIKIHRLAPPVRN